jgi:hypothetical protein
MAGKIQQDSTDTFVVEADATRAYGTAASLAHGVNAILNCNADGTATTQEHRASNAPVPDKTDAAGQWISTSLGGLHYDGCRRPRIGLGVV